ncbi:hypothetical protein L6452_01590 [Arctium lappa]|uniref:Uncharacterized protein n=1 Tax=Arctium lappa TaxID=4217 RepID=A0ACB9FIE4_ARCLA|nr:hypothetical protein L6452_01590 [Arctium lappa]
MYSPVHFFNKVKSMVTFQYEEDFMALLMDGNAALSLDLSFVTHVFLMEPIWDKSMKEQILRSGEGSVNDAHINPQKFVAVVQIYPKKLSALYPEFRLSCPEL